jgi:threonine dehydrogenase-like Zn-dependent dehydrogenase
MSEHEIIFPSKGNFIYADCQKPPLGDGEVRGRTLTSLVSPGTELAWATGEDFPVHPGYAAVFEVEECGKDVTDIEIGQDFLGKVALVVDCSGHEKAVLSGCRIVRQHGEVVLIGVPWKRHTDLYAHDILHAVFNNFVLLRSGWEWEYPLISRGFKWAELLEGYNNTPQSIFSGFAKALNWLSQGRIPLTNLVKTVSPADPSVVYGALLERKIAEPFLVFNWERP